MTERTSAARPLVPRWFRKTVAYAGGTLVVGALAWARRVTGQIGGLATSLTASVDQVRSWLVVVGIVLVVQNVEGNVLQPLVQGHQVRLHPVVIIVVVTAGYLLFGIRARWWRSPWPPSPIASPATCAIQTTSRPMRP